MGINSFQRISHGQQAKVDRQPQDRSIRQVEFRGPARAQESSNGRMFASAARLMNRVLKIVTPHATRVNQEARVAERQRNAIVAENLSQCLQEKTTVQTLAGRELGISSSMWRDLDRAEFCVEGEPLINKQESRGADHDALRRDAVEKLKDVTGANPRQLMALSKVTHQGAMSFISHPDFTNASSIRLADGTPVRPMGRVEPSYNVYRDASGRLLVRCHCEIPVTSLLKPDGTVMTPETGTRAQFTYEVEISRDGDVTIATPLRIQHEPDAWSAQYNKPYPKPTTMSDLFGSQASKALLGDFREFCAKEYTPENFQFLDALEAIGGGNWTQAQATQLYDMYIKAGAPMQVNISGELATKLGYAIDHWGELTPAEQIALFNPARDEVRSLIWRDTNARFTAAPNQFQKA
jgi:hypothetical protein